MAKLVELFAQNVVNKPPEWWDAFLNVHGEVPVQAFSIIDTLGKLDTLPETEYYNSRIAESHLQQLLFIWLGELIDAQSKLIKAVTAAELPTENEAAIEAFAKGAIRYSVYEMKQKYYLGESLQGKEVVEIVLPGKTKPRGNKIEQPFQMVLATHRTATQVLLLLLEAQGRWVSVEDIMNKTGQTVDQVKRVVSINTKNATYPGYPWNPISIIGHSTKSKSKLVTHYRVQPSSLAE